MRGADHKAGVAAGGVGRQAGTRRRRGAEGLRFAIVRRIERMPRDAVQPIDYSVAGVGRCRMRGWPRVRHGRSVRLSTSSPSVPATGTISILPNVASTW